MPASTPLDEVEIEYAALDQVSHTVRLPRGAQVIQIDFADLGGLGHRRTPIGVWFAVATADPPAGRAR